MSDSASASSYPYPSTNAELVRDLALEPHPEGGFYTVTWEPLDRIPSPYAGEKPRNLASCIFYLLAADDSHGADVSETKDLRGWSSSIGRWHINKSATMHVHHQGRTRYILIQAAAPWGSYDPSSGSPPQVRDVVMGSDLSKGEVRQLLVESGWWKVSMIPETDRQAAARGETDSAKTGALISEIVCPGFDWEDHTYMKEEHLQALFPAPADRAQFEQYLLR